MCVQVIPIARAVMRDAIQRSFAKFRRTPHLIIFSAGVGTVSSSRCTAPGCSRATPWTPTSAPRRRVKVGGKIICTLPQKISERQYWTFLTSLYQYPHPPLTPLSCLLWISANFAFKENWANFIQTNSNESWAHIISGTRLRNLILSGELVPKDLSPSSGGADDWKTSFQGRERDSFGNFIPWLGRISQKLRKPAGL